MNLVYQLFNEEIGQSWHSKVTYDFPCTVAFFDVMSQWPQRKLETSAMCVSAPTCFRFSPEISRIATSRTPSPTLCQYL